MISPSCIRDAQSGTCTRPKGTVLMAMHGRLLSRSVRWLILVFLSVLLLGACTVPKSMQVRSGADPRHQDDQVRFRTTYYFRVLDLCRDLNGNMTTRPPQLDSLYRFRMTGKASSIFTQVRFESGILHETEIDPFGSSVVFDDKLGRHRFVTRDDTDAAVRQNDRHDEKKRWVELLKILDKYVDEQQKQPVDQTAVNEVKQLIMKVRDEFKKRIVNFEVPTSSQSIEPEDSTSKSESDSNSEKQCPEGTELRRGFQILGPEGVATFNQNHRLVMAMTSSGKPLIGALKELSGRMLKEHDSGTGSLLPLVRENLTTLRAGRVVDRFEQDPNMSVEQLIEQVINAFNLEVP